MILSYSVPTFFKGLLKCLSAPSEHCLVSVVELPRYLSLLGRVRRSSIYRFKCKAHRACGRLRRALLNLLWSWALFALLLLLSFLRRFRAFIVLKWLVFRANYVIFLGALLFTRCLILSCGILYILNVGRLCLFRLDRRRADLTLKILSRDLWCDLLLS